MSSLTHVQMPKACISCSHFEPVGKKFDPLRPTTGGWIERKASWPYGQCRTSGSHVWGTELCNRFESDELIEVVDVTQSRQAPIEPRQEALF